MTDKRHLWFLVVLLLIAIGLMALMLAPFAGTFFAAAVLATVLIGIQQWLTRRCGGRANLAATLITLATILVILLPLGMLSGLLVREVSNAAQWIEQTMNDKGIDGLIERLPPPLPRWARFVIERLPPNVLPAAPPSHRTDASATADREDDARPASARPGDSDQRSAGGLASLGPAASAAGGVLGSLIEITVHTGIFLIALFFLLTHGVALVDYLVSLAPLAPDRTRAMFSIFRQVSVSVVLSTLATAVAQTLAALVGYLIAGIPLLALTLFATFVCAFIPAIGAASIATVAGVLVWLSGRVGMGIFLTAWGIVAVGLIDNVLKPLLAKRGAQLPSSVIFFAMVCGLAVFGPVGLVAGPLTVVFFHVTARMVREGRRPDAA